MEPWTFTLRELIWMATEREEVAWNHTSMIAAMIANTTRDPKRRRKPFSPREFNPMIRSKRSKLSKAESKFVLKSVLIDKTVPKGF